MSRPARGHIRIIFTDGKRLTGTPLCIAIEGSSRSTAQDGAAVGDVAIGQRGLGEPEFTALLEADFLHQEAGGPSRLRPSRRFWNRRRTA
jgi:hypothetical protein